jgi:uncharacterized protein with HEPN domain
MHPDYNDMARFWDILDAARAAAKFTQGRSFEDFLSDRMLRNAVERNLEIIGEAARYISRKTRDNYPDIPWKSMIALRNIITHEYGDIRYEILWSLCREKLPALINTIEAMGADNPPPDETQ